MSKHTEIPWSTKPNEELIYGSDGEVIMIVSGNQSLDEDFANAEFIVTACNCHDELLAACKTMKTILSALESSRCLTVEEWHSFIQAEKAITKAEGGE